MGKDRFKAQLMKVQLFWDGKWATAQGEHIYRGGSYTQFEMDGGIAMDALKALVSTKMVGHHPDIKDISLHYTSDDVMGGLQPPNVLADGEEIKNMARKCSQGSHIKMYVTLEENLLDQPSLEEEGEECVSRFQKLRVARSRGKVAEFLASSSMKPDALTHHPILTLDGKTVGGVEKRQSNRFMADIHYIGVESIKGAITVRKCLDDGVFRWDESEGRPSTETLCVIAGMLDTLLRDHIDGRYHGSLDDARNIVFSLGRDYLSTGRPYKAKVHLLNGSRIQDPSLANAMMSKDIKNLRNLIFEEILGAYKEKLSEDLKHLESMMKDLEMKRTTLLDEPAAGVSPEAHSANISQGNQLILKISKQLPVHPGLWSSTARCDYLVRMWHRATQTDFESHHSFLNDLRRMDTFTNWHAKIPINSPFHNMIQARVGDHGAYDTNNPYDLLRFTRTAPFHIHDMDGNGDYKYFNLETQAGYLDLAFVERELSRIFPLMIVQMFFQGSRRFRA